MTAVQKYRDLVGPPQKVQTEIARLTEQGLLAAMTVPYPHPNGWRVRVWYRQPVAVARPAPVEIARARRVQEPLWWEQMTRAQRRLAGVAVMAVGGVVLAVGVAWLLVAAITGAVRAATSNVPVLLLLALVAGVVGWLWLRWKVRNRGHSSSSGSCAGLVQHCGGCGSHGS